MSKLRGHGRLLLLVIIGTLVIYVLYNYVGKSSSVRSLTDSTVLKYHQLAGKVDVQQAQSEHTQQEVGKEKPVERMEEARLGRPNVDTAVEKTPTDEEDETNVEEDSQEEERQFNNPRHSDEILPIVQAHQDKPHKMKFSPFVAQTEPDPFPMYTDKKPEYQSFFSAKKRLVHLDLKGAPPKLSYLEKLFPLFREWGATGLLIEYEDSFPYKDSLSTLAAKNAYTKDDILRITTLADRNNLEIIPLVQTFGHMEFVLKGKMYRNLRENDETPQVIMPTDTSSQLVIKAMIEQVQTLHPKATHLHIGCDEVYRLGEGKSRDLLERNKWSKHEMFFTHIRMVAKIVRGKGLQPIMWDDMLRKVDESELQESGLGGLVQPMIWEYRPQPQRFLPTDMWPKYGKVFRSGVWVASSFKGATGSAQYVTNSSYHLENHLNWVEIMKHYGGNPSQKYVDFKGVVLTGWQRYDHFATLCELLPVALPTLAVCLQTIRNGYFNEELHEMISKDYLQCKSVLELRLQTDIDNKSQCNFPGHELFYAIQELYRIHEKSLESPRITYRLSGWLSSYNVKHNFTSPGQTGTFLRFAQPVRDMLVNFREKVQPILSEIFDQYTVEEFLEVQIDAQVEKLDQAIRLAKSLGRRQVWPRRPVVGNETDEASEMLNLYNRNEGIVIPQNKNEKNDNSPTFKHPNVGAQRNGPPPPNILPLNSGGQVISQDINGQGGQMKQPVINGQSNKLARGQDNIAWPRQMRNQMVPQGLADQLGSVKQLSKDVRTGRLHNINQDFPSDKGGNKQPEQRLAHPKDVNIGEKMPGARQDDRQNNQGLKSGKMDSLGRLAADSDTVKPKDSPQIVDDNSQVDKQDKIDDNQMINKNDNAQVNKNNLHNIYANSQIGNKAHHLRGKFRRSAPLKYKHT